MNDDKEIIAELVRVVEMLAKINQAQLQANAAYDDAIAEWMPSAYAVCAKAKKVQQ